MPAARVNDVPLPGVQPAPLFVLYSQVASDSIPTTFTCPLFVIPSLLLDPVSAARENVGLAGAVVSTVMEIVLEAVFRLPALSVKVLAATLIVAVAVLLVFGVKVAV